MLDLLFTKLTPIVLLIVIGYYWKKKALPYDKEMLSSLVMNLGAPALLIAAINNESLTLNNMATILTYGTLIIIVCAAVAAAYLKIESKPIKNPLCRVLFSLIPVV
jgi:predicted permease